MRSSRPTGSPRFRSTQPGVRLGGMQGVSGFAPSRGLESARGAAAPRQGRRKAVPPRQSDGDAAHRHGRRVRTATRRQGLALTYIVLRAPHGRADPVPHTSTRARSSASRCASGRHRNTARATGRRAGSSDTQEQRIAMSMHDVFAVDDLVPPTSQRADPRPRTRSRRASSRST